MAGSEEGKTPKKKKKRITKVCLYEQSSQDVWGSGFCHSIYLIKEKYKSFTLVAEHYYPEGEDEDGFENGIREYDRVSEIFTPEELVDSYRGIGSDEMLDQYDIDVNVIAMLDPVFAKQVQEYLKEQGKDVSDILP